jgi:hypothetical protein
LLDEAVLGGLDSLGFGLIAIMLGAQPAGQHRDKWKAGKCNLP